jgi:hypothetical protein
MFGLGQPVLDSVGLADHVEAHRPGVDGVPVSGLLCELDSVVGQDRVDLVGHGLEHVLEELPGRFPVSRCNELGDIQLSEVSAPVPVPAAGLLLLGGLATLVAARRRHARR